ncbi:MAG: hypothetical protein OXQ29_19490, partial [Rhodospirillaceae bacterium]|nr:hypothetical protein [Rhodospirillaceae bacterium]
VTEQLLDVFPLVCVRTKERCLGRLDPGVYGAADISQKFDRGLDGHAGILQHPRRPDGRDLLTDRVLP